MYCMKCNSSRDDSHNFCWYCGDTLIEKSAARCRCGYQPRDFDNFCAKCRSVVILVSPATEPITPNSVIPDGECESKQE